MSNTPKTPADAGPSSSDQLGLAALRGIAAQDGKLGKCEWCGTYCRLPCQCPAEVEIERLRTLLRRGDAHLRKWAEWYGNADHYARGQLPLPPAGDIALAEDIAEALRPNG